MPNTPRTHLVMAPSTSELLFDAPRRERLRRLSGGEVSEIPDLDDPACAAALADAEVLITSWGAPQLTAERLARMPRLRAVFHAAGSVRALVSDAVWERDLLVTSAAEENAIPVAEFAFAAIVLATKRTFFHVRSEPEDRPGWIGNVPRDDYGTLGRTIGVVAFSRTGRRLVRLLTQLEDVRILVADPYADADEVRAAGGELVPLSEMLGRVDVLSLHAPSLPSTRHMIGAAQLAALRDGAVVLNTARGSILDHDALAAECGSGRLDAILDVTDPEPLPLDSPLLRLPNVAITPHLAGSLGSETRRLADEALDELEAYAAGRAPLHPVAARELEVSA
ncbi:hydroxyacid dehydrogenase [Microbacterium sp. gxy059]|uniref:hydroxyacid dehydrogenase n=1 Tax=Microbacterium sp. gxy059 TaxID=2957199 RepID=UPI003D959C49